MNAPSSSISPDSSDPASLALPRSSSSSPTRLMVGGEDSSYLRPIPEDDDDDDDNKSSQQRHQNSSKNYTNPHLPTSANLSLLDSANPFLLPMGLSGATVIRPMRQHDVSSDDARSSTRGIIVDPRGGGGGGGAGVGNISNGSVVGTDKADLADDNGENNNNHRNRPNIARPNATMGSRPPAPEQQLQNHSSTPYNFGVRHRLSRRHSQVSERWKGLSKRNQFILVGTIILTILVAVAIVLVIVFTTVAEAGENSSGGSTPSQAPTTVSSISPSTAAYLDEVLFNVSSTQAFQDPSSPQSQARDWLYNDLLLNDAIDDGQERVVQRYVCVELVYALNIPESTLQSDKVECDWDGFSCDEDYRGHVITNISLPSMNLTGTLPDELAQLPYLQRLELYNNSIGGPIPDAWMSNSTPMQNLYRLDLSENKLTGSVPEYFWTSFLPLSYVYLNDNQFSGKLLRPSSTSSLDLMEEVWMQRNQFTGTLPAYWMLTLFPNLEKLKLGGNQFTGTIPTPVLSSAVAGEVLWPANMSHYDVSANRLRGTIPASLFYDFASLQSLYVHSNSFTGQLASPSAQGAAASSSTSALSRVLMHSNLLNGSIPADFGSTWKNLNVLTIHNNSITGSISPTLQCTSSYWPNLTEVWADCPDQVSCTCPQCNCSSAAR